MKKHNFYAGPSILPQSTIDETAKAVKDFAGTGLSVMEIFSQKQRIHCSYGRSYSIIC